MKTAIRTFWQSTVRDGLDFLEPSAEKMTRAHVLVQFFYLLVLYLAFEANSIYSALPGWREMAEAGALFEPNWSVRWIPMNHWELVVRGLTVSFLVLASINALFWRASRGLRLATFLSFFLYLSLISSFGRIYHYYHIMLVASFLLIGLPNARRGKKEDADRGFLEIILGIQAFMLLTYTSSGFFKFQGLFKQLFKGTSSALSPDALAIHSAKESFNSGNLEQAILASLSYDGMSIMWSFCLVVAFLIELCSIYIIFRPALHAAWAVALAAMHIGIVLLVGPAFPMQALLVCLFLGMSPFALGWVPGKPRRAKSDATASEIIIFYDGQCLMCNGFIKRIAHYALPNTWKIATIQGGTFQEIAKEHAGLQTLDSLIIVEREGQRIKRIRAKSNGVTWCLAQLSLPYKLLRLLHLIAPFPSNFVYDVVAQNRVRTAPDACPVPPPQLRNRMLDQ